MTEEKPQTAPQDAAAATVTAEDQPAIAAEEAAEDAMTAEAEAATAEDEQSDLRDQLLRAMAEVENTRRRTDRELQQARRYGHAGFARDLLTVVDNLSRAVDALPADRGNLDETMTNLVIGVEMIHQEITSVLQRHGISRINPKGEKFDYALHQAMFEVPTDDVEPGIVVEVAQPGWVLHDRLLSPAMVGVAKAPPEASAEETVAETADNDQDKDENS